MNEKILEVLQASLELAELKRYKPRVPKPDETEEQKEIMRQIHEIDFFKAESFKLGRLLRKPNSKYEFQSIFSPITKDLEVNTGCIDL